MADGRYSLVDRVSLSFELGDHGFQLFGGRGVPRLSMMRESVK